MLDYAFSDQVCPSGRAKGASYAEAEHYGMGIVVG